MFYVHHSGGWGWGWWVLMTFAMIAFWAVLIYGLLWLVRSGRSGDERRSAAPEPPKEIVKRRLAQGEISLDEYESLVEALEDRDGRSGTAADRQSDSPASGQ
jgi:putative membrane protein